jgi:ribonucleoside-triphosphate reductase
MTQSQYTEVEMSIEALQDYVYTSKYSRYTKQKKRREVWRESVHRVRDMHLSRYPQIADEIIWAFDQVLDKRVLGSQRALQFGGEPILRKHARQYNCIGSYCDRMRFFQETFWLLLCGCGTGFSVQQHHVAKLPDFDKELVERVGLGAALNKCGGLEWDAAWKERRTFVVPDTIEGWSDALGILLATYLPSPGYEDWLGVLVEFDLSLIRPAGSSLSSGSGKAPGPEPLRRSLEVIRGLLNKLLKEGRTRLRPIDAYDVIMHASDAVLSGGVRRSATICIFSLADEEMMKAKTGDWFFTNPQRGRSNNSVLLLRNKVTEEEFLKIIESVREFGEPGFMWSDSTELVVNPCVEIGFWPVDEVTLQTGWQACNLSELNGSRLKTSEDWMIAARAAAIIGTCQAGYTDFDYLGEVSKRIIEREALLGVSITGMMDSPTLIFDEALQRAMAEYVLKVNEEIAAKIGIRPTARATCIKPSGTASCVLGTGSGIHPHHARRYIRRIQGNVMEAPLQFYKVHNPHAVEKSVWSANGTDEVISFAIEVSENCRVKPDLSAIQMLDHVRLTQVNWVMAGCVPERCTQPWLRNNVSNTINVKPEEWEPVGKYIYKHRENFAGVSLLPVTGDRDYPQSPMVQVFSPQEITRQYGNAGLFASGLIVDGLHAFGDNLWMACEHALGHREVEPPKRSVRPSRWPSWLSWLNKVVPDARPYFDPEDRQRYFVQLDWVRRAVQFADRYFGGNVKAMTYCLKDVDNWHAFVALQRQEVPVDYSEMMEEEDNTKLAEAMACSGGKCELV